MITYEQRRSLFSHSDGPPDINTPSTSLKEEGCQTMNGNNKVMNGVENKKPRTGLTAFFGTVMKKLKKTPTGLTAFFVTVIFLFLGFFALWFRKDILKMGQDALLVAIVLIPALLFLILSDKVQEFGGGWLSLKFRDVAGKLDASDIHPLDTKEVKCLKEVDVNPYCIEELKKQLKKVSRSTYIVLPVTLGRKDHYHTKSLLDCLRECAKYPNFKFLVVLKPYGAVFAYTSGSQAIQILELEQSLILHKDQESKVPESKNQESIVPESSFIKALNEGCEEVLLDHGLEQTTLRTTDTKITALNEMTELNMDALIVTDNEGKLIGVVDREQILSSLMLAFNKSK
jgi:hypothetical protein